MATAQPGDTVEIDFVGRFEDGEVFDSSEERGPITFTIGGEAVIEGLQNIVKGMEPGETKAEEVPPEHAYGHRRSDMVKEIERAHLPDDMDPEVGVALRLRLDNGRRVKAFVSKMTEDTVTIDANHPLAGQTLTFEVTLNAILDEEPVGEAE
ncbi:FKBP-type peptidyl-prolyl cis-trans isomerase [Longimonas halophila]|uniref:FKBP-type peptidyl-prolyl cis-trans isomerase n=1 Tax=Longimonas halophila TaxID=1469170 RepID=UPI00159661F4|nr:FKBP-type peptidyl-prolyl cis-trans isomerase [Longimonas halophila]